jgi:hypothetical protein
LRQRIDLVAALARRQTSTSVLRVASAIGFDVNV